MIHHLWLEVFAMSNAREPLFQVTKPNPEGWDVFWPDFEAFRKNNENIKSLSDDQINELTDSINSENLTAAKFWLAILKLRTEPKSYLASQDSEFAKSAVDWEEYVEEHYGPMAGSAELLDYVSTVITYAKAPNEKLRQKLLRSHEQLFSEALPSCLQVFLSHAETNNSAQALREEKIDPLHKAVNTAFIEHSDWWFFKVEILNFIDEYKPYLSDDQIKGLSDNIKKERSIENARVVFASLKLNCAAKQASEGDSKRADLGKAVLEWQKSEEAGIISASDLDYIVALTESVLNPTYENYITVKTKYKKLFYRDQDIEEPPLFLKILEKTMTLQHEKESKQEPLEELYKAAKESSESKNTDENVRGQLSLIVYEELEKLKNKIIEIAQDEKFDLKLILGGLNNVANQAKQYLTTPTIQHKAAYITSIKEFQDQLAEQETNFYIRNDFFDELKKIYDIQKEDEEIISSEIPALKTLSAYAKKTSKSGIPIFAKLGQEVLKWIKDQKGEKSMELIIALEAFIRLPTKKHYAELNYLFFDRSSLKKVCNEAAKAYEEKIKSKEIISDEFRQAKWALRRLEREISALRDKDNPLEVNFKKIAADLHNKLDSIMGDNHVHEDKACLICLANVATSAVDCMLNPRLEDKTKFDINIEQLTLALNKVNFDISDMNLGKSLSRYTEIVHWVESGKEIFKKIRDKLFEKDTNSGHRLEGAILQNIFILRFEQAFDLRLIALLKQSNLEFSQFKILYGIYFNDLKYFLDHLLKDNQPWKQNMLELNLLANIPTIQYKDAKYKIMIHEIEKHAQQNNVKNEDKNLFIERFEKLYEQYVLQKKTEEVLVNLIIFDLVKTSSLDEGEKLLNQIQTLRDLLKEIQPPLRGSILHFYNAFIIKLADKSSNIELTEINSFLALALSHMAIIKNNEDLSSVLDLYLKRMFNAKDSKVKEKINVIDALYGKYISLQKEFLDVCDGWFEIADEKNESKKITGLITIINTSQSEEDARIQLLLSELHAAISTQDEESFAKQLKFIKAIVAKLHLQPHNKDLFEKMIANISTLPLKEAQDFIGQVTHLFDPEVNFLLEHARKLRSSENDAVANYLGQTTELFCMDLMHNFIDVESKDEKEHRKLDFDQCKIIMGQMKECIEKDAYLKNLERHNKNFCDALLLKFDKDYFLTSYDKRASNIEDKQSLVELKQKFSEAYDRRFFSMGTMIENRFKQRVQLCDDLYQLFSFNMNSIDAIRFELATRELKHASKNSLLQDSVSKFSEEFEKKKKDILSNPEALKTMTTLAENATICAYKPTMKNLIAYDESLKAAESTHVGHIPWRKSKLAARAIGFGLMALGVVIALGSIAALVYTGLTSAPLSLAGLQIGAELMGAGAVLGVVGAVGGNKLVHKMEEWLTNRNVFFKSALELNEKAYDAGGIKKVKTPFKT